MIVQFASDNTAGAHPKIMAAIEAANVGYAKPYGNDDLCQKAKSVFAEAFGAELDVFFVGLGTAANILCMKGLLRPWQAVVASDMAHILVDECGGLEANTGSKIEIVPSFDGKMTVEGIAPYVANLGDVHRAQPRVLSITQTTECGTVYTPEEIRVLADYAHANGMVVHMDGARICNAVASLGCSLADITVKAGVDVLSFGGTKNGLLYGEAVVFFTKELAKEFPFARKQGMQLFSKMRFIAAQFIEYMHNELWRANAQHANDMARLLVAKLETIPHVKVSRMPAANSVFAVLAPEHIATLQEQFYFYEWDATIHEVRWMTSFATTEAELDYFVSAIKGLVK